MLKVRCYVVSSLISLGLLAGAASAPAATLVEHNVQPLGLTPNAGSPPEFGRCIKTSGGEFADAGCTRFAGGPSGGYEWHPAFGGSAPLERTGFTTTLKEGTVSTLETVGKTQMVCEGAGSAGEYTGGATVGKVVVTFTGCSAFSASCASAGSPPGTVLTRTLEGTLGIEELGATPADNLIAEDLYPAGRSGAVAELSCDGVPVKIAGSLIVPVPSNSMKLTVQVRYKSAKGRQKPESFAGEPADVLLASIGEGSSEQAGESMVVNQVNEEKIEVNSVV